MKFKYATPDKKWFIQIYDDCTKSQAFTAENRPGQYAEMKAWEAAGNKIEPYETESEISEREAQEKKDALQNQKQTCKRYLDETDYLVSNDTPYPGDLGKNKAKRAEWRRIMNSEILEEIPLKTADE